MITGSLHVEWTTDPGGLLPPPGRSPARQAGMPGRDSDDYSWYPASASIALRGGARWSPTGAASFKRRYPSRQWASRWLKRLGQHQDIRPLITLERGETGMIGGVSVACPDVFPKAKPSSPRRWAGRRWFRRACIVSANWDCATCSCMKPARWVQSLDRADYRFAPESGEGGRPAGSGAFA